MGVQVSFDYNAWIARYPEFSSVSAATAQQYFNEATIYHRNDGVGRPTNPTAQLALLNMITAHIAALYAPRPDGTPASELVGRVSSATEGSVTVSADLDIPPGTAQWFAQTKYGLSYWNASRQFRTMKYVRGHPRVFDPLFPR